MISHKYQCLTMKSALGVPELKKLTHDILQGVLTEGEGLLQLTSLHKLVWIRAFVYLHFYLPFLQNNLP
jgi:hypothetical protein